MTEKMEKAANRRTVIKRAVVVEGRDDIAAVSRAVDALIIATHGFGITEETWGVIGKAYEEKGLIILTDPDHAGEQIRKRLDERFPGSLHAYIARADAIDAGDIGVENASPESIRRALVLAEQRAAKMKNGEAPGRNTRGKAGAGADEAPSGSAEKAYADMRDLTELGLAGSEGSAEARARVCRALGIGYGNARAMIKRLRGFGIGIDELKEEVKKIQ